MACNTRGFQCDHELFACTNHAQSHRTPAEEPFGTISECVIGFRLDLNSEKLETLQAARTDLCRILPLR